MGAPRASLMFSWFPHIARGHSSKHSKNSFYADQKSCHCPETGEAYFKKDGTYIDGHFQSQEVARRAHELGLR